MLEKDIERILTDGVKEQGGRTYKWVSPGNAGVPDRIVALPGRPPVLIELKTESGTLTALQKVQIRRLKALGLDVRVLHGPGEVKEFLKECRGGDAK